MNDRDKRDYFRLTETIDVAFEIISKSDINGDVDSFFPAEPSLQVLKEMQILDLESKEILRAITDNNRQLGSFLQNINKRMSLFTQALVENTRTTTTQEDQAAQVSEGGISFISSKMLNQEELLALKMHFHPSLICITCFAKVKHCRLEEHGIDYRIGTEFVNFDQKNQRLLSRYIIQRQAEARRRRLRE